MACVSGDVYKRQGMVRQWQTLFYGKRYSSTVLDDAVDFVKLSEALGAKAIRVTDVYKRQSGCRAAGEPEQYSG